MGMRLQKGMYTYYKLYYTLQVQIVFGSEVDMSNEVVLISLYNIILCCDLGFAGPIILCY